MSPNHSHLIPTAVTDKNGRRTIVYRRENNTAPASAPSIPPASLPKTSALAQYLSGLDTLSSSPTAVGQRLLSAIRRAKINKATKAEMIAGLHEETLTAIQNSVLGDIAGVQHYLIESCMRQRTLIPLNNSAVVAGVLNDYNESCRSIFHTYVAGLQMYREQSEPLVDWSSSSAAERDIPRALIRAAIELKTPYSHVNRLVSGHPRHVASNALAGLIMERPQDVQRIIALVNQRELAVDTGDDISNLRGLLDQKAESSLLSGLL